MSKKTHRGRYLLILSIVINALVISPAFAASKAKVSKPQMAGRTATVPSNTILSGTGAPKTTVGIDGDFYLDTKATNFYGPKSKGRWPAAISLRGPQGVAGATGSSGSNGSDGRNAVSAASITGAQGLAGPAGAKGETGAAGVKGDTGPAGVAGLPGPQGPAGLPGSNGAPGAQGSPGNTGATGAAGSPGNTGATGAQGSPGAAGSIGATGPSSAIAIPIAQWSLSTSSAGTGSDSLAFGTLAAGKSYRISIIVHGYQPTANSFFGVELRLTSSDGLTFYESMVIDNKVFILSSFKHRYTFLIEGTVVVGASDTSMIVRVIDGAGVTSGAESMTLSGKAIFQLVGQVT